MKKIYTRKETGNLIMTPDGEIVNMETTLKVDDIDNWCFLFLEALGAAKDLDGAEIRLLLGIWRFSTFNNKYDSRGNRFFVTKDSKKKLIENDYAKSESAVGKYINTITSKGYMIRICRGEYLLNPKYIFKGYLTDRSNVKLMIEYGVK